VATRATPARKRRTRTTKTKSTFERNDHGRLPTRVSAVCFILLLCLLKSRVPLSFATRNRHA
jgi:hypothetical protein